MTWHTWKAASQQYMGLKVGVDYLNLSKDLWDKIKGMEWDRVGIDYDPDARLIRLKKDKNGANITKNGTIAAKVPMPMVRYELDTEDKEYLYFQAVNE